MWRGTLAIAIGIVAIVWPSVTVSVLVALFAIYVFCDAVGHFYRAYASERGGTTAGHVTIGLLDVAAGVVALVWPTITLFVLAIWLAAWAVVTGVIEIGAAFTVPARRGIRTSMGLFGAISLLFGIVLFTHPHTGILAVTMLFGLFLLIRGVELLMTASRLRSGRPPAGELPGEPVGGWKGAGRYADAEAQEAAHRGGGQGSRRW
jgi:uncharacterized membrane protein HdeD (DUF308 family)